MLFKHASGYNDGNLMNSGPGFVFIDALQAAIRRQFKQIRGVTLLIFG
jgi:hypothetical protein